MNSTGKPGFSSSTQELCFSLELGRSSSDQELALMQPKLCTRYGCSGDVPSYGHQCSVLSEGAVGAWPCCSYNVLMLCHAPAALCALNAEPLLVGKRMPGGVPRGLARRTCSSMPDDDEDVQVTPHCHRVCHAPATYCMACVCMHMHVPACARAHACTHARTNTRTCTCCTW